MPASQQNSIRFNPLTALLWLVLSGGVIFLLWNVITRISDQNMPVSTPTADQTQVYQTIAVMVTAQNTGLNPTALLTVTPSPTTSLTPTAPATLAIGNATSTPGKLIFSGSGTPGRPCNQAEAGSPIDITIPDDSEFSPGDSFVKTWKLVNTGTCTWTTLYSANFFYGDRMDASREVPLQEAVLPEQEVEISIEMLAPKAPGTYQGNWKLSSENGELFGIGPNADSPFWVRIVVVEEVTDTPAPNVTITPAITPTSGLTPTETQQGDTSGTLSPIPGDTIDLDSLTLNSGGIDLAYQVDSDDNRWLVPLGETAIGIFGSQEPTQPDCQGTLMSSDPLAVESLDVGIYLCYITNDTHYGRALLEAMDPETSSLTLDLFTWVSP